MSLTPLLQRYVLRARQALPLKEQKYGLFHPRVDIYVAARGRRAYPLCHLYDDIFLRRSYAPLRKMPVSARVLDVGAHLGLASLFFLTEFPDSRVTSFEPNPNSFELLAKTLAPFGIRANAVQAAVGAANDQARFFVRRSQPTSVTAGLMDRETLGDEMEQVEVKVVDLRSYLKEKVDFMKLDAEGAEYAILPLPEIVPEQISQLAVEFHDIERHREEFSDILNLMTKERHYSVFDAANQPAATFPEAGSVVLKFAPSDH